jgi:Zn-dependent M28 family amino/carboxypeptidase
MERMRVRTCVWVAVLVGGCSSPAGERPEGVIPGPTPSVTRTAIGELPEIDGDAVLAHTRRLSSDELEGRAPGTNGEQRTVDYVVSRFQQMGLKPGNPDSTYIQAVPLVGLTAAPAPLVITAGSRQLTLAWRDDVVANSRRVTEQSSIEDSELVFVGYGVVAPEYDWDDYKGLDVTGKTLLMLVNDPPVRDLSDPSGLDPSLFGGRAMTYYGRWTYKYEIGSAKGAAAVFIVHDTEGAGYGFDVVQNSWGGEQFDLVTPDKNMGRAAVEGWLPLERAREILSLAGHDLEDLRRQAATREFKPVPLGITASMTIRNTFKTVSSRNVLARLEGRDPLLRAEHMVYMAHWDHLGVGEPVDGDTIYNGAVDNAVGVAGLLEIARAFASLPERPKRSVLFLAVTAEEHGLLGSEYYARVQPLYPIRGTVAAINIDTLNVYGRTRDLTIVGLGASELDDYVREAAGEQGRVLRADPEPERGFYYRSDHFSFAKAGVPALFTNEGVDFLGRPPEFGREMRRAYTERHYHKPSDVVYDTWDLSGAREDLKVLFAVGYRVAEAENRPRMLRSEEVRK